MISITYTPTREIVGGGGNITAGVEAFNFKPLYKGVDHESLDGTVVSVLHAYKKEYSISIEAQTPSQLAYWREWQASSINNETFTVVLTDIPAAPTGSISCRLKRNTYRESRLNGSSFVSVAFTIVEL